MCLILLYTNREYVYMSPFDYVSNVYMCVRLLYTSYVYICMSPFDCMNLCVSPFYINKSR